MTISFKIFIPEFFKTGLAKKSTHSITRQSKIIKSCSRAD